MLKFGNSVLKYNEDWINYKEPGPEPYNPKSVKIGDQVWMSENLDIDDGEGGITKQIINGILEYRYTREAAMRIASKLDGWHLPTDSEWRELFNYVSNGTYYIEGADNHIYDLRSTTGWYNDENGTNLTGFNAYPTYRSIGDPQTTNKDAEYLVFDVSRGGFYDYGNEFANITYDNKARVISTNYEFSLSVRLIKDREILPYPKYDINPLKLPRYTFRVRFQQGHTPTNSKPNIWSYTLVSAADNIWDITYIYSNYAYKLNAGGVDMISSSDRPYVVELLGANTQGVIQMAGIFSGCTNMTSISTRFDCAGLESCTSTFYDCESLREVPVLNYYTSCNVNSLFSKCYNVERGALDLYKQLVNHNDGHHTSTFYNCGSNTQTGAAELAQIPSDWK